MLPLQIWMNNIIVVVVILFGCLVKQQKSYIINKKKWFNKINMIATTKKHLLYM